VSKVARILQRQAEREFLAERHFPRWGKWSVAARTRQGRPLQKGTLEKGCLSYLFRGKI